MKTFFIVVDIIIGINYYACKIFIWRIYKIHLANLKFGMIESERKYFEGTFTLKDIVDISKYRIRVDSAPIIKQDTLFYKYIFDFFIRYGLPIYKTIKKINENKY